MQISNLFIATATTLGLTSNAFIIPRQTNITDEHLANFRTWGAPDCPGATDNEGEWNSQIFNLNICYQFPNDIEVESLELENIDTGVDITCSVYVFTDDDCTVDEVALPPVGQCYNYSPAAGADPGMGSYKIACSDE
ncbi:hypothetical protein M406DRAFT_354666 [Cryphonectria parasitica EP155]|uniref:Uncharacterized protein n=1 Tax=Cryphonectria parasitica (strain ATCC 38755 / EP155) TaxID=660469 RepID=A0A9P5CTU0_CRYP1|nr:uncharacterized protein M406DRAFT_354666 [Cryphonectria parasitica EP155]KAF3771004.1 hypothetical protein M406DRAFT_354666 [Cryphonectria parasitica EP155]